MDRNSNSVQVRQFMSIQVALGQYVYLCACPLPTQCMHGWMDERIDGWTDTVDEWTYASTIIGTSILCETLRNLLFFSRGGSAAGKGIGSNLQHLVARYPWSLTTLVQTSKQTTSMYRDQQHEKHHKQNPPYCHNLSHRPESFINHTTSNTIKPKKNMEVLRYCTM